MPLERYLQPRVPACTNDSIPYMKCPGAVGNDDERPPSTGRAIPFTYEASSVHVRTHAHAHARTGVRAIRNENAGGREGTHRRRGTAPPGRSLPESQTCLLPDASAPFSHPALLWRGVEICRGAHLRSGFSCPTLPSVPRSRARSNVNVVMPVSIRPGQMAFCTKHTQRWGVSARSEPEGYDKETGKDARLGSRFR